MLLGKLDLTCCLKLNIGLMNWWWWGSVSIPSNDYLASNAYWTYAYVGRVLKQGCNFTTVYTRCLVSLICAATAVIQKGKCLQAFFLTLNRMNPESWQGHFPKQATIPEQWNRLAQMPHRKLETEQITHSQKLRDRRLGRRQHLSTPRTVAIKSLPLVLGWSHIRFQHPCQGNL